MIDTSSEFRTVADVTQQLSNSIIDLFTALVKKNGFIEDLEGTSIVQHMMEGGTTLQTVVSLDRVELMTELLKKNHIAFLTTTSVNPVTGEQQYVFVMKNTQNTINAFNEVQKEFQIILDADKRELNPDTFFELHKNNSIGIVDSVSKAEVLAFRNVAKHYDFKFAITSGRTEGTFAIYCSEKEQLNNAMLDVAYNMVSDRGEEYVSELNTYANNIDSWSMKIHNIADGDVLYIVDANDPRHFISVNKDEYMTHSINIQKERIPGGQTREILADTMYKAYSVERKEELIHSINLMKHPVYISQQEFNLVEKLSKNGEAILAEDFAQKYKDFKEFAKSKEVINLHRPVHKNAFEYASLDGYINLPKATILKLEEANIKGMTIIGNDIAFEKGATAEIERVLEQELYKGLTPLKKREAELFYKGAGDLMLSSPPLAAQFIISAENPNFIIKNNEKGLTVYKDGQQQSFVSRDMDGFEGMANTIIGAIHYPAILTYEEMLSPNRIDLIKAHMPSEVKNVAIDYLKSKEAREKIELHSNNKDVKLNDRQKAALELANKYNIIEKNMERVEERAASKNIAQHDFGDDFEK